MANMADFAMSYSSLETAAKDINSAKSDLETLIASLNNVVSVLGDGYTGKSYEAFRQAWSESKTTMEKLKEAVGNFAPALTSAAAEQRESDNARSQKMSSLSF